MRALNASVGVFALAVLLAAFLPVGVWALLAIASTWIVANTSVAIWTAYGMAVRRWFRRRSILDTLAIVAVTACLIVWSLR